MNTLNGASLVPAYGRDYKSAAEAIASLVNGKDWQIASMHGSGSYCGIADLNVGDRVSLRYAKLRKQVLFTKGQA
jgi:uncharacterized protein with PIN domain